MKSRRRKELTTRFRASILLFYFAHEKTRVEMEDFASVEINIGKFSSPRTDQRASLQILASELKRFSNAQVFIIALNKQRPEVVARRNENFTKRQTCIWRVRATASERRRHQRSRGDNGRFADFKNYGGKTTFLRACLHNRKGCFLDGHL